MKKLFLLCLALIVVVSLCACNEAKKPAENDNTVVNESDNQNVDGLEKSEGEDVMSFDEIMKNLLEIDHEKGVVKITDSNNKIVDLNFDYVREFYRVINSYPDPDYENYEENTAKFATIQSADKDFPTLIINYSGDIIAWDFDGEKLVSTSVTNTDSLVYLDKQDSLSQFGNYLYESNDLYNTIKSFKDSKLSLEDYMKETYTDENVYYGSSIVAEEDESGNEIRVITSVDLEDDGNYYFTLDDNIRNINRKVKLEGIDGRCVNGFVANWDNINKHPDKIYELTDKGELFVIEIPETGDTATAKKVDNISNAFTIIGTSFYPYTLNPDFDATNSYEAVITASGEVISLYNK